MTQPVTPRTAAGKATVEWAENAYGKDSDLPRYWREHVLAIEAQAASPEALDVLRQAMNGIESGLVTLKGDAQFDLPENVRYVLANMEHEVRKARAALSSTPKEPK